MANHVRETQEKRRREQARLARQASKDAERRERDARKKADREAGVVKPPPACQTAAEMLGDLDGPAGADGQPASSRRTEP